MASPAATIEGLTSAFPELDEFARKLRQDTASSESTTDQWFTESQFESYRSLGLDIANNILSRKSCCVPRTLTAKANSPSTTP